MFSLFEDLYKKEIFIYLNPFFFIFPFHHIKMRYFFHRSIIRLKLFPFSRTHSTFYPFSSSLSEISTVTHSLLSLLESVFRIVFLSFIFSGKTTANLPVVSRCLLSLNHLFLNQLFIRRRFSFICINKYHLHPITYHSCSPYLFMLHTHSLIYQYTQLIYFSFLLCTAYISEDTLVYSLSFCLLLLSSSLYTSHI